VRGTGYWHGDIEGDVGKSWIDFDENYAFIETMARAWAGRPRGRGRLRRIFSLGAVIAPEDAFLSWFSLPAPNPNVLRRVFVLEPSRDRGSGSVSFLAPLAGANEEILVVTVLGLTVRCCNAWGTDTSTGGGAVDGTVAGGGVGAVDGIGAGAAGTSWRITTWDKEILIARCGCG